MNPSASGELPLPSQLTGRQIILQTCRWVAVPADGFVAIFARGVSSLTDVSGQHKG